MPTAGLGLFGSGFGSDRILWHWHVFSIRPNS